MGYLWGEMGRDRRVYFDLLYVLGDGCSFLVVDFIVAVKSSATINCVQMTRLMETSIRMEVHSGGIFQCTNHSLFYFLHTFRRLHFAGPYHNLYFSLGLLTSSWVAYWRALD